MRRCLRLLGAVLILGGCATAATDAPLRAQTVLRDKSGQQVGSATLTEGTDGVRIRVTASHLPPGPKGVHVHAVGTCDPPDFVSAGAHFNPTGRKHGRLNPDGSHAGDLPNLVIDAAGSGSHSFRSRLGSSIPSAGFDGRSWSRTACRSSRCSTAWTV